MSKYKFWPILTAIIFFRVPSQYWFAEIATFGNYKISTTEIAILGFFFLLMHTFARFRVKPNMLLNKQTGPILPYIFFVMFSAVLAAELPLAAYGVLYTIALCTVYVTMASVNDNDNKIESMLKALFFVGVIITLYAIYLFPRVGDQIFLQSISGEVELRKNQVTLFGTNFMRYTMPGIDKNKFGIMLSVICLFGIFLIKRASGKLRVVYLVSITFLFLMLVFTFSKGAMLSFAAGLLYLFFRRWFTFRQMVMIIVTVLVAIFSFDLQLFFSRYLAIGAYFSTQIKQYMILNHINDTSDRTLMMFNTLDLFLRNPFWGLGPDHLGLYQNRIFGTSEHNAFLALLAESGIFAFIALIAFLAILLKRARSHLKKLQSLNQESGTSSTYAKLNDEFKLRLGEILTAAVLTNIVNFMFAPIDYYFWICAGLLAAWTRNSLRKPQQPMKAEVFPGGFPLASQAIR